MEHPVRIKLLTNGLLIITAYEMIIIFVWLFIKLSLAVVQVNTFCHLKLCYWDSVVSSYLLIYTG